MRTRCPPVVFQSSLGFLFGFILFVVLSKSQAAQEAAGTVNRFLASNDVVWTTLGKDENDSMPIGNGDLAANVWTEQSGEVVLLVAKADAWTELGKLVKLGRVRIRLEPNLFAGAADFTQALRLETGAIELRSGDGLCRVWVDANQPALHVEAHLKRPGTMQAALELWRTNTLSYSTRSPERGGFFEFGDHALPIKFEADTILAAQPGRITWCHFNPSSIYPTVLQREHLESLLDKYPDPLLHRCFGGSLSGPGLVSNGEHTLKSAAPGRDLRLDLVALTQAPAESAQAWQASVESLARKVGGVGLERARRAHEQWWQEFWNRSWIHVEGAPEAAEVSQGYAMQRWMMACSSRGAQPVKFNGGLFTVGHDIAENRDSTPANHNPDFRQWGNCYWNQNNRLLYWPLLASGDLDLVAPWFNMYVKALPLAKERTRLYFHHDGAAFIETIYFWGLPNLNDFGWDNPSHEPQSTWIRHHTQGGLEVVAQMLDSYDYNQDAEFARGSLVPFADASVTYYARHWPRDANAKLAMSPTQSLETYQRDASNPTPDIAGLMSVLPRLLALPTSLTSPEQRNLWAQVLRDLPPIPMGKTARGKLPALGRGDEDGTPTILPAEKYGRTANSENPELYVAFPYRLYGVGKPNLELARSTYAARLFPQNTCWGQDGTQAAVLGLTAEARKAVTSEFTRYGNQRFRWFWNAGHDWIPDLDNGGSGMMTLQLMLMQCDGQRIQLLPAWPTNWTADFKLHAPYQTTVAGHVANGMVTGLKVTPRSRAKDVTVVTVR